MTISIDRPLFELRWKAQTFLRKQRTAKRVKVSRESAKWIYHNTFLGRRVERHVETGNFRIIGGQVTVNA